MSEDPNCGNSGSPEMEKTIKTLSNTITTLYEGDLKQLNSKLTEYTDRQKQLGSELETAKEFYTVKDNWRETEEMMRKIGIYKEKLIGIRRNMIKIQKRMDYLKNQANKIQEFKIKQLNQTQ